jgi:hypothetical protein
MFLFFFLAQRIVIYYAVHRRAILKIVKSMCNGIKKKSNARTRNVIQM